jgi:hypothetical protein
MKKYKIHTINFLILLLVISFTFNSCRFKTNDSANDKNSNLAIIKGEDIKIGLFQNGSPLIQNSDYRMSEIPQSFFGFDYLVIGDKTKSLEISSPIDTYVYILTPEDEPCQGAIPVDGSGCFYLQNKPLEMLICKKLITAGSTLRIDVTAKPISILAPEILLNSDTTLLEVKGKLIDIDTVKPGNKMFLKDLKTLIPSSVPEYLLNQCFAKSLRENQVIDSVRCYKPCVYYLATTLSKIEDEGWIKIGDLVTDTDTFHMYKYSFITPGKWVAVPDLRNAPSIFIGENIRVVDFDPVLGTPLCASLNPKNSMGDPTMTILPSGDYLAACRSYFDGKSVIRILKSKDKGLTWSYITELPEVGFFNFFILNHSVYIMGTKGGFNEMIVRRSDDEGETWTTPNDSKTGWLTQTKNYHSASVSTVFHNGRVWRAFEDNIPKGERFFRAFMMSAPINSNLLDASNWTFSEALPYNNSWLGDSVEFKGWFEGNAVVTPDGKIVDILRVETQKYNEMAAIIHFSDDGKKAFFDPKNDIISFPGGEKKFTIQFDSISGKYWTLSNCIFKEDYGKEHGGLLRNRVVLSYSADLYNWNVKDTLISLPDAHFHGYQYLDWRIDGKDIVAVSRTASGTSRGLPRRQHDANYFTFHRFANFRD